MAKYDGLIIPRSYSEYINKTDAATHQQAHQVSGVLDNTPTENSPKAVKSGGVYTALASKQPTLTFDDVPTDGSDNPVKSNGIYDALAGKQDTLTFDNVPTEDSDNPVKSGGVYDAVKTTIKKENFENLTLICSVTGTGERELLTNINNFSLVIMGVSLNTSSKRTSVQLIPTLLIRNRNSAEDSITLTNYVTPEAYISFMFHYVDNTHIYIDQVRYSQTWSADGYLFIWGIK